jgi:hypothetical protein
MAGLATAIGLGGKLPASTTGIPEIIDQTGDAISGNISAAGQGVAQGMAYGQAKQKEKDALTTPYATDIMALDRDRQQYIALASDLTNELKAASEAGASASELREMKIQGLSKLATAKAWAENNLKAYEQAAALSKDSTKDISEFNRFFMQGGYDETDVYEEGNVGAGPVMPKSGAPYEEGQEQIPGKDKAKRIGVPYYEMTWEQQMKAAPGGLVAELGKRTKDVTGKFPKAAEETFDKPDLGFLIRKTWTENPDGTGQYTFDVDPENVANHLNIFLAQKDSNYSTEVTKYWNTLKTQFERMGKDQGFAGEDLKEWVDKGVTATATKDFIRNLESARLKRMENDREDLSARKEGKGFVINFGAGGGTAGNTNFAIVKEATPAIVKEANKAEADKYRKEAQRVLARMQQENEKFGEEGMPKNLKEGFEGAANTYSRIADYIENMPVNNGYVVFSSQDNTIDSPLNLTDGTKEYKVRPTVLFKRDGKIYVGGMEERKTKEGNTTITKDVPVTLLLNEANRKILGANKKGFEQGLQELEKGFFAEKPSEKKKETKKPQGGYKIGQVVSGYEYTGGDPTKQENWKQVKK